MISNSIHALIQILPHDSLCIYYELCKSNQLIKQSFNKKLDQFKVRGVKPVSEMHHVSDIKYNTKIKTPPDDIYY